MNRIRLSGFTLVALLTACGGDGPAEPEVPVVATVTVAPASADLGEGDRVQFTATARDAAGVVVTELPVTWTSSDEAVASVNASGTATGNGPGEAEITATVGGVSGSAMVTVTATPCTDPTTVSLAPGAVATFLGTDCLILPAGDSGDRYRVALFRPATTTDSTDVLTATLEVTALDGVAAAAAAAPDRASAPPPLIPGLSGAALARAHRVSEATRRFHERVRQQEKELMGRLDLRGLAEARSRRDERAAAAVAPALADAPERITLDTNTGSSCETGDSARVTALLVYENEDLVFYQDSTQRASNPLSTALASRMASYYTIHSKAMIEAYFGTPPDIDGNGKVTVFVTPVVKDDVAAFVWSGDFLQNDDPGAAGYCAASNHRELIYFNLDLIQGMEDQQPTYQALGTLAHEMKHVVSLYNRYAATARVGRSQFHPSWIEEGTSEIASEMSSRIAWASIGGPGPGDEITRQDFLDMPQPRIRAENYGVTINLARTVWYLSSQPNGLLVTPVGADPNSSVYGSGWVFHRWLGDAYGGAASAPMGDAALFRALTDSMAAGGTQGLADVTGTPFVTLHEEFVRAVVGHGVVDGLPGDFTTFDFPSAAEIFCTPNPVGVFPWPVTSSGTAADCDAEPRVAESSTPSATFGSARYTGPLGPSGLRIHDFVSNGTGGGLQVKSTLPVTARMMVVRIR